MLKRQCEVLPEVSGVYAIHSKDWSDVYIGSSKNLRGRFVQHRADLAMGYSPYRLKEALARNGEMTFSVLTVCSMDEIRVAEDAEILSRKPNLNCRKSSNKIVEKGPRDAWIREFTSHVIAAMSQPSVSSPAPQTPGATPQPGNA